MEIKKTHDKHIERPMSRNHTYSVIVLTFLLELFEAPLKAGVTNLFAVAGHFVTYH